MRALASQIVLGSTGPVRISQMRVVRTHLATVDSTNTFAKARLSSMDAKALNVVSADEQTGGRGRGDRVWRSGDSAKDITATFAFHVPPEVVPRAYQLSPLIALVAARVLRQKLGVAVSLKWPNDLIFGGQRKFGGILCELDSAGGSYWAILGIGINVNSTPADLGVARPLWPLTTLSAELGAPQDTAALTDALVSEFAEVR
jgi:BirA family transcriptional regulator, biotin operon repressor / biotin---[acetyl-CoA-carboxylase] ligase